MLNPYASKLGNRDALEVIAATPNRLRGFAEVLGPAQVERCPAAGKWSAKQILSHLADCEVVFAYRIRQALAEEHHVIQPFDQDLWASAYAAYDAGAAVTAFSAVRQWNLALIRSVTPGANDKLLTHPERGTMAFRVLIETMGGHDLNHLAQLESIAAGTV